MIVIDPGHVYQLQVLDNFAGQPPETLVFVKREGKKFPGNIGHHYGTNMQETLRACIDRSSYVYHQIPCWQTWLAIRLMKVIIWLFEHRASRRHNRPIPTISEAVYGKTCKDCGHWDALGNNHGGWGRLK